MSVSMVKLIVVVLMDVQCSMFGSIQLPPPPPETRNLKPDIGVMAESYCTMQRYVALCSRKEKEGCS